MAIADTQMNRKAHNVTRNTMTLPKVLHTLPHRPKAREAPLATQEAQ